jgi:hypothetical protein
VVLLDNYTPETGEEENLDEEELKEQDRFLNAILKTKVIEEAQKFLVQEGKAPKSKEEFKEMLSDIWFEFYSRSVQEE